MIKMTNDQTPMPNQAPNPNVQNWDLNNWDFIGHWSLGVWDFII